jgi:hypothetical protein
MKSKKTTSSIQTYARKRLRRAKKDTASKESMSQEEFSSEGGMKVMPFLSEPPSFDFTRTEKKSGNINQDMSVINIGGCDEYWG